MYMYVLPNNYALCSDHYTHCNLLPPPPPPVPSLVHRGLSVHTESLPRL